MKKAKLKESQQVVDHKDIEINNLKVSLARALADYDNLQKRVERQSLDLYSSIAGRVMKRILPIFDMINDAQSHLNDPGLAITIKEFEDVIRAEGFEMINPPQSELFDSEMEEAVDVVETSDKNLDNTVAEVSLTGWKHMDGPVLRHAKVKVYKYKENKL